MPQQNGIENKLNNKKFRLEYFNILPKVFHISKNSIFSRKIHSSLMFLAYRGLGVQMSAFYYPKLISLLLFWRRQKRKTFKEYSIFILHSTIIVFFGQHFCQLHQIHLVQMVLTFHANLIHYCSAQCEQYTLYTR